MRHLCALVVAGVAAHASYVHQRDFALQGGADAVTSALWPLSVDGRLLGRTWLPLGTAHKQGRIAGDNALGGKRWIWL
ncbi:DUF2637 domain-containing protein [Streptomyces sp. NPDC006365]|uniref:DUF2637 domain-containing protein n=1 Tax=Streptomyces sp. NPDC006365 TaxID=3364744 RepID=UPI00368238C2